MAEPRKRLLLAESNEKLRSAVCDAAGRFGFDVISTALGPWVLSLAANSAPDLVVIDISLDGLDGRDVLAALKKDPRTAHIPVLVWSGRKQHESDRRISLDLGAEDYAEKSDAVEMLAKAKRIMLRF